jgi:hypothetical protein
VHTWHRRGSSLQSRPRQRSKPDRLPASAYISAGWVLLLFGRVICHCYFLRMCVKLQLQQRTC